MSYSDFKKQAAVRRNAVGILVAGNMNKQAAFNLGAIKGLFKSLAKAKMISEAPHSKLMSAVRRHSQNTLRRTPIKETRDYIDRINAMLNSGYFGNVNNPNNANRAAIDELKALVDEASKKLKLYKGTEFIHGPIASGKIPEDFYRLGERYRRFAQHKLDKAKDVAVKGAIGIGSGLAGLGAGLGIGSATNDKQASYLQYKQAAAAFGAIPAIGNALSPAPAPATVAKPQQQAATAQNQQQQAQNQPGEQAPQADTNTIADLTASLNKITDVAKNSIKPPAQNTVAQGGETAQAEAVSGALKAASLNKAAMEKRANVLRAIFTILQNQ